MRRGSDWCWPPQPIAAGSNASCTTAPSSAWSRSRSSCSRLGGSSTSDPAAAGALIDEIEARCMRRWMRCGRWRSGSILRCSKRAGCRAALRTTAAMRRRADARRRSGGKRPFPRACRGGVFLLHRRARAPRRDGEDRRSPSAKRTETVVFEIVAEGSGSAPADADLTPDPRPRGGARRPVDDRIGAGGGSRIAGSLPTRR